MGQGENGSGRKRRTLSEIALRDKEMLVLALTGKHTVETLETLFSLKAQMIRKILRRMGLNMQGLTQLRHRWIRQTWENTSITLEELSRETGLTSDTIRRIITDGGGSSRRWGQEDIRRLAATSGFSVETIVKLTGRCRRTIVRTLGSETRLGEEFTCKDCGVTVVRRNHNEVYCAMCGPHYRMSPYKQAMITIWCSYCGEAEVKLNSKRKNNKGTRMFCSNNHRRLYHAWLLDVRNNEIRRKRKAGAQIAELAEEYQRNHSTIRLIVRGPMVAVEMPPAEEMAAGVWASGSKKVRVALAKRRSDN